MAAVVLSTDTRSSRYLDLLETCNDQNDRRGTVEEETARFLVDCLHEEAKDIKVGFAVSQTSW